MDSNDIQRLVLAYSNCFPLVSGARKVKLKQDFAWTIHWLFILTFWFSWCDCWILCEGLFALLLRILEIQRAEEHLSAILQELKTQFNKSWGYFDFWRSEQFDISSSCIGFKKWRSWVVCFSRLIYVCLERFGRRFYTPGDFHGFQPVFSHVFFRWHIKQQLSWWFFKGAIRLVVISARKDRELNP